MAAFKNYVAGEWVDSAQAIINRNPADLADVVGEFARGDKALVGRAVAAAQTAFVKWSQTTPQERADILDRIGNELLAKRDDLGKLLTREEGKVIADGVGEVVRAGAIFKFFAGEALRLGGEKIPSVRPGVEVEIAREPVGVVGIITPWNFPIAIPAWKVAPALAYGNCVVLKPAELVPGCAWALADIIHRAGFPPGVFNLVVGRGSVVGEKLVTDARIDAISFTGSVATGQGILAKAAGRGAKVQLE